MSSSSLTPRRQAELARDKPQGDRAEHANLERRLGAHSHPSARPQAWAPARAPGWALTWRTPAWPCPY